MLLASGCQPDGLQKFESESGNFRATFPGQPTASKKSVDTELGPMMIHTFGIEKKDGTYWSVTYFDFPKKNVKEHDADSLIDGTANGACAKWEITSNRPIKLAEHSGREIRGGVEIPEVSEKYLGTYRAYLVGSRMYQLIILGPRASSDPKALDAFFDSFALLKSVPVIAGTALETEPPASKAEPEPEGSRP